MAFAKLNKDTEEVIDYPIDFLTVQKSIKSISVPVGFTEVEHGDFKWVRVTSENIDDYSANNFQKIVRSDVLTKKDDGNWYSPTYSVTLKDDDDLSEDLELARTATQIQIDIATTYIDNKISSLSDSTEIAAWNLYKTKIANTINKLSSSDASTSGNPRNLWDPEFPRTAPDGSDTYITVMGRPGKE